MTRSSGARTCEQGCNGCDECTDYEDDLSDWVCDICHGDGMDPFTDYLLPCQCQGEQKPSKEPTP
jgi:hypothetical protein